MGELRTVGIVEELALVLTSTMTWVILNDSLDVQYMVLPTIYYLPQHGVAENMPVQSSTHSEVVICCM